MRYCRRDRQELRPSYWATEDLWRSPSKNKRETPRTHRRLHRYQKGSLGRRCGEGNRQGKEGRSLQRSRSAKTGSRNRLTGTVSSIEFISSRQTSILQLRFFKRCGILLLKWR